MCCADYQVEIQNNSGGPAPVRPFRVTFPPAPKKEKKGEKKRGKKRKTEDANGGGAEPMEGVDTPSGPPKLVAESYVPPNPGPYPQDKPPENQVAFTPVQVSPLVIIWHGELAGKLCNLLQGLLGLLDANVPNTASLLYLVSTLMSTVQNPNDVEDLTSLRDQLIKKSGCLEFRENVPGVDPDSIIVV